MATYERDNGTITAITYDPTGITVTITSLDGAAEVRLRCPLGSAPYLRLGLHRSLRG